MPPKVTKIAHFIHFQNALCQPFCIYSSTLQFGYTSLFCNYFVTICSQFYIISLLICCQLVTKWWRINYNLGTWHYKMNMVYCRRSLQSYTTFSSVHCTASPSFTASRAAIIARGVAALPPGTLTIRYLFSIARPRARLALFSVVN